MLSFDVTLERSAYRVITLKVSAESEEAAEEAALKASENLDQQFENVEVLDDDMYEDTESSWVVNATIEGEYPPIEWKDDDLALMPDGSLHDWDERLRIAGARRVPRHYQE